MAQPSVLSPSLDSAVPCGLKHSFCWRSAWHRQATSTIPVSRWNGWSSRAVSRETQPTLCDLHLYAMGPPFVCNGIGAAYTSVGTGEVVSIG